MYDFSPYLDLFAEQDGLDFRNVSVSGLASPFPALGGSPGRSLGESSGGAVRSEVVPGEFIVRMSRYVRPDEAWELLHELLGHAMRWGFPTSGAAQECAPSSDFFVVRCSNCTLSSVRRRLRRSSLVSEVYPQHRYRFRSPQRAMWREAFSQPAAASYVRLSEALGVEALWRAGITGSGVRVGVLDTGLREGHSHFAHIGDNADFTGEALQHDPVGHGTLVAGVIGGGGDCGGVAPGAELHIYRVFSSEQESYTSWFLEAFNRALRSGVHILNLSIGGPDYLDAPFVWKVREVAAAGVVIVSAVGNDGPLLGTLNNPADHPEVLGVGAVDYEDRLLPFSSRGPTKWEFPRGMGRAKPDLLAYGRDVWGPRALGGCRALSGTSVAAPVVAGALALLASALPPSRRPELLNPAAAHLLLSLSADSLPGVPRLEQGSGRLDVLRAWSLLDEALRTSSKESSFSSSPLLPHVRVDPPALDLTDCPKSWPHCLQPLYAGALPVALNLTILNPLSARAALLEVRWVAGPGGEMLRLAFDGAADGGELWPFAGALGVRIAVEPAAAARRGDALGEIAIRLRVQDRFDTEVEVRVPLRAAVVPTPPREERVLIDVYHSLHFPGGFFPGDALPPEQGRKASSSPTSAQGKKPRRPAGEDQKEEEEEEERKVEAEGKKKPRGGGGQPRRERDAFDWLGDHPFTNYRQLFERLRSAGYYVEVLERPLTCLDDAAQYGALLLIDPEDEFHPTEITLLHDMVRQDGLAVLVLADWYNAAAMASRRFYDENTQRWWTPLTGGANVPALNRLLEPFGAALGDRIFEGEFVHRERVVAFRSGTAITRFPADGLLVSAALRERGGSDELPPQQVPILGFLRDGDGVLMLYGDSSCVDDQYLEAGPCFDLLLAGLEFAILGSSPDEIFRSRPLPREYRRSGQRAEFVDLPPKEARAELAGLSRKSLRFTPECPLDDFRRADERERLDKVTFNVQSLENHQIVRARRILQRSMLQYYFTLVAVIVSAAVFLLFFSLLLFRYFTFSTRGRRGGRIQSLRRISSAPSLRIKI